MLSSCLKSQSQPVFGSRRWDSGFPWKRRGETEDHIKKIAWYAWPQSAGFVRLQYGARGTHSDCRDGGSHPSIGDDWMNQMGWVKIKC